MTTAQGSFELKSWDEWGTGTFEAPIGPTATFELEYQLL